MRCFLYYSLTVSTDNWFAFLAGYNNYSSSNKTFANELKRIEDSLASVRKDTSITNDISGHRDSVSRSKDRDRNRERDIDREIDRVLERDLNRDRVADLDAVNYPSKPMVLTKHSTKIDNSYTALDKPPSNAQVDKSMLSLSADGKE